MVKFCFIKEIRSMNKGVEIFEIEVVNFKICLDKILVEIKDIFKNIVKRGMGKSLYFENFFMVGKIGIVRIEYWVEGWEKN